MEDDSSLLVVGRRPSHHKWALTGISIPLLRLSGEESETCERRRRIHIPRQAPSSIKRLRYRDFDAARRGERLGKDRHLKVTPPSGERTHCSDKDYALYELVPNIPEVRLRPQPQLMELTLVALSARADNRPSSACSSPARIAHIDRYGI